MDTQTQIDRLIELAIIQRSELKQLVEQLPQLREHLNAEVEKVFDEAEPQLRAELEEWTTKQTADKTAALGVTLEAKIADLAKSLEVSTQARYNAIIAEREENARLAAQAEAKIAEHAASLPSAVKEIVSAELARFPRAGEIDQLRKEFAEPRGLNPRGKWQAGETYNRLDLVTYNGDSFVSNIDGNTEKPSRNAANWTLNAARGAYGGGGGITSLNDVLNAPTSGQIIGSQNGQYVPKTLVAGANITINETASSITIIGDEGQISLQDGTAAAPSLFFTNDPDTGIYRPAANTLGISVSGTQVAYFDQNGLTVPNAGIVAGGSFHGANGNANNPSLSFDGDQDTGFFRHQANEIGIALGGTQYATLTSTTFSITPVVTMASSLRVNGTTDSSSKDTGAIVTEGGLGVEKSASIGGNLTVSGTASFASTLTASGNGTFGGNSLAGNRILTVSNTATADGSWASMAVDTSASGLKLAHLSSGWSSTFLTNGPTTTQAVIYTSSSAPIVFGVNSTYVGKAESTGWTLAGNLTVSGTGTSSFSGILSEKTAAMTNPVLIGEMADSTTVGVVSFSNSRTSSAMLGIAGTTTDLFLAVPSTGTFQFRNGWTEQMRLFANGNLFVGASPTDGGQKLQVSGSGIFGNTTAASTTSPINVSLGGTYGTTIANGIKLSIFDSGVVKHGLGVVSGVLYLATTDGATTIQLATNSTTALTLDSSQNATFAGNVTVNGVGNNAIKGDLLFGSGAWPTANYGRSADRVTISSSAGGPVLGLGDMQTGVAANRGATIYLFARGTNGTNDIAGASFISKRENATSGNFASTVEIGVSTASISNPQTRVTIADATTTFANAIAIGNTVQTAAAVASTHKVTISIGGSTYYLLATNV